MKRSIKNPLGESKEQKRQRILKIFNEFDEDGSGTIDDEEFVKGMSNYFNISSLGNKDQYNQIFLIIFKMCDKAKFFKRNDGVLDFNEFERIVDAFPPAQTNASPNVLIGTTLFNIVDGNRSGRISRREMSAFLKYFKFKKEDIKKFMKALDTDRSGKIELDEFLEWFKSYDVTNVDENGEEEEFDENDFQ